MIRTIALLGLVASAAAFFPWHPLWDCGLYARFSANLMEIGKKSFYSLPRTCTEAKKNGWKIVERPTRNYTSGYDKLEMWVNPNNRLISIIVDENCNTIGLQIAFKAAGLQPCYDMVEQGFTKWIYTDDAGDTIEYWTICLFFGSEDEETRCTAYNDEEVLQTDYVLADGPKGTPYKMATNHSNVDNSIWFKQACIPFMGTHYYYNMTKDLSCDAPIANWFPLYDTDTSQMMGVGFMVFVRVHIDGCEAPTRSDVEMIVPTAPECMYDMVDSCGVSTLHIYFVDKPYTYFC